MQLKTHLRQQRKVFWTLKDYCLNWIIGFS